MGRWMGAALRAWRPLAFAAILPLAGCELSEVTLTEPENILVAEVYVMVGDGDDQMMAFLHWTLGPEAGAPELGLSSVHLITEDSTVINLQLRPPSDCLLPEALPAVAGACFKATPFAVPPAPGSPFEVEIIVPDGRTLRGTTTVPEAFDLLSPAGGGVCYLGPNRPFRVRWSRSEGAWAYGAEAQFWGLRNALKPQGIEVEEDSVALLGLAVSDNDTTIVFPGEFGVFNRFELDRDLALALQKGMPQGAVAQVVVGALDRNYVNWVRGGNFNPSGPVRVSSIQGPGIGVFGSVVRRTLSVVGGDPFLLPGHLVPSCLPPPADLF